MSEAAAPPAASSQKAAATKKKKSAFCRCLKSPMRALRRLRDIYVKSLGSCAGAGGGRRGGGYTAGVVALMPRGRSQNAFGPSNRFGSVDDDFRDLVRVSSQVRAPVAVAVPRSQSAAPAIGRIEEETSAEFEDDGKPCPRSQSCAVVSGGKMIGVKAS